MNVITPSLALLGNLAGGDMLLIFFLVLMFFGAKKLPEMARSFGLAMKEFKKAASDVEDNFQSAMREDDRNRRPPPPPPSSLPPPPPYHSTDQASQVKDSSPQKDPNQQS